MSLPFDHEESLTHEEIQLRFKKILGREMTADEKKSFFLPVDPLTKPSPDKG
jgi:hypothetical protein